MSAVPPTVSSTTSNGVSRAGAREGRRRGLALGEHARRAEIRRERRLAPHGARDPDLARAERARGQDREQAERAGAEHEHACAVPEPAAPEPAHDDRRRLGERCDARVEVAGRGTPPGRHDHVLREAAVLVHAEELPVRAERIEALPALDAHSTALERLDGDGGAGCDALDPGPDRVDDAGELVAGREPRPHEADARRWRSLPQMPHARTRTRTSPAAGSGRSSDASRSAPALAPDGRTHQARRQGIISFRERRGIGDGSEHSVPWHT